MEDVVIRQWVQAMAADDTEAFKQFFDHHYPRFYRLAFYYTKSDVLSEELVSDVFLKIWNNRNKLPEIERLDYYFFQSVKNQALTYLKRESKLPYEDENALKSSRVEYCEPENLMIARELAAKIEEAIGQLPGKCEVIFRLVREEGMSYKEVAGLLDIAPKTVENQMHIALKKLKIILDEYQQAKANSSYIPYWFLVGLLDFLVFRI